MESIQELASNAATSGVILDQQDLWWTDPPRVWELALLSYLYRLGFSCFWYLRRHCVWDVVDVLAVHGIDSIVLANGVNQILEVFKAHGACRCRRRWSTTSGSGTTTQHIRRRSCQRAVHPHSNLVHVLQVSWVQHDVGVGLAQEFRGVLQRRGWMVVVISLCWRVIAAIMSRCAVLKHKLTVPALLRVNAMQECHYILHDMLVVNNGFLETNDFLQ